MSWIQPLIAPAWNALTVAQKTAWGDFAAANPYINSRDALVSTSGYSMFTSVNTWLITTDEDDHLDNPPSDLITPPRLDLRASTVRTKALLADGSTNRKGKLILVLDDPVPANTLLWIRNITRYTRLDRRTYKQPHKLTYLRPGESGTVDLTVFRGLPLPGGRTSLRQRIIGVRARKIPQKSAAQIIRVDMTNGRFTIGTLFHDH